MTRVMEDEQNSRDNTQACRDEREIESIMEVFSAAYRHAGFDAFSQPTQLRALAQDLGLPYLLLLFEADLWDVRFDDIDELLESPVALAVARRRWRAQQPTAEQEG